MKRGTASRVILGKNTIAEMPGGVFVGTDVILGKKDGLTNDFNGLVLSNTVMFGKKVSHAAIISVIVRGANRIVLPDAIANSLSYVKAFGGTEQRNLPDGYTQVEYLESDGNQYIDTGIVLKSEATITTVAQANSFTGSGPFAFWGFLGTNNLPRWGWSIFSTGWLPAFNATSIVGVANTNKHTFINNCYYDNGVLEYDSFLDGSTLTFPAEVANAATYTSNTLSAYLFARNNNGTAGNFLPCRIFSYEIVQDGVKVLSLVPCRRDSDNVLGMYDRVSGAFLTNDGTGTFTAGPTAVPTPDVPMSIVSNNGVLKFGVLSTNLLDLANCTDGYYYTPAGEYTATPNARLSNYIPVKAGVTYTVGLMGEEGQANVRINLFDTAKNWLAQTVFASFAGEKRTQSITPTQDGFLAFSANYLSSSRVDWNTAQVVQGSYTAETMPEYEPYQAGIYADGTVETVGIKDSNNLLPVDAQPDVLYPVTVTSAGGWIASANVANGQNIAACEIRYYNANKQQINYYTMNEYSDGRMHKTFTVTTLTKYVSISRKQAYATIPVTELKVETGGTMTPYYNGGTATAEMLLKVGDYQDVQSMLDGVVTRNVGVKVLDGTEDWSRNDTRTSLVLDDSAIGTSNWGPYCTHYQSFVGGVSINYMPDNSCKINVNQNNFLIKDATHNTDLATWKQYLANQYAAGTPVIVVYPLETPTTESVAGQTLQVTGGDNVLEITQASLTGLELEAQYNTLVQLTVQEVENANLDNDVTVTIQ